LSRGSNEAAAGASGKRELAGKAGSRLPVAGMPLAGMPLGGFLEKISLADPRSAFGRRISWQLSKPLRPRRWLPPAAGQIPGDPLSCSNAF
jgi:hypothetical protein